MQADRYCLDSRKLILAALVGLHVLTLLAWQAGRRVHAPATEDERIQWVWVQPRSSAPLPPPDDVKRAEPVRPRDRSPREAVAPAMTVEQAAVEQPAPAEPTTPVEPPAAVLADDPFNPAPAAPPPDLATAARLAAGKIDKQLRGEKPRMPERAPVLGPQQRFAAAVARAVAQRWNGPATIEEAYMPDGSGDKVYRIKTAFGTYCARYTHPRAGIDAYEGGRNAPKITNCPH